MPWRKTEVADQQLRFIVSYLGGEEASFARLCQRFEISRKTGYKRVARYLERGLGGIGDLSRAPHSHPNATPAEVVETVVSYKREHLFLGPRKVVAKLRELHPEMRLPAASTVGRILDAHGLVRPRRRRRRTPAWDEAAVGWEEPNDTWSADFKGFIRTGDGKRCDPLTICDACGRYLLACQALSRPTYAQSRPVFERTFLEYGLPLSLRTDNGWPFASVGLGGLTPLTVWWVELGIVPERIAPGHPEPNGRHARMHRGRKEQTASRPAADLRAQQVVFDRFRQEYNHERPHEALGQQPPASVYRPSERSYPEHVRDIEYAAGLVVRRVRSNGEIKWKGDKVVLTETLAGRPVGLRQVGENPWAIHFGMLEIGLLDDRESKVIKTPVKVSPMSSV